MTEKKLRRVNQSRAATKSSGKKGSRKREDFVSGKKLIRLTKRQKRTWKRRVHLMTVIVEYTLFSIFVLWCCWMLVNTNAHFVDGDSMSPTLSDKDRLLIHKTTNIQRYDLITFEPADEKDTSYIKRVIGIAGDRVQIFDERLVVSLTDISEEEWRERKIPDSTIVLEIQEQNAIRTFQNLKEIPANYYLVVGDNRENSRDSRAFGLVHENQIEGVVLLRFAPFQRFGIVH